jgi:hypothetical protein
MEDSSMVDSSMDLEEGEEEEQEEGKQEEKAEDELAALEDEGRYFDYGSRGNTKGKGYGMSNHKSKGEGQRTCQ